MLFIFNKYGRDFYSKNKENRYGITYESLIQDIEICTKLNVKKLLDTWIFNVDVEQDLPFIEYLQHFGINCSKNIEYKCDWGIQYNKNNTFVIIDKVNSNSLACKAKLMAGDILVSINNTSILSKDANEIFDRINKDEPMLLQYIRNRQLKQIVIKYEDMQQEKIILNIEKDYNMKNIWTC
jgi:predicted metalloprotease with PDZ domain